VHQHKRLLHVTNYNTISCICWQEPIEVLHAKVAQLIIPDQSFGWEGLFVYLDGRRWLSIWKGC